MPDYKLVDHSSDVIAAFKKQETRGMMAIGETAVGYAKVDTPVDTGRLRNSEDYKIEDNAVYIGTNVEYAPVQENIHHFLKNAAANHGDEYKKIMETSLKS